jgi:hypothetical protein
LERLIELGLGEAGEAYVRRRLSNGKSLAREVLRTSQKRSEEPVALVPPMTTLERALRLDEGGLASREAAIDALRATLADDLATPGRMLVVEDELAHRGDPALARRNMPLSFFGDEVYCWTADPVRIPDVLDASASHFVHGFVTAADPLNADISAAELAALARATSVIALNAYDDELRAQRGVSGE